MDPHRVVGPYRCLRLIRGVPGVPLPEATRSNISIEWTRYKTRASHAARSASILMKKEFTCKNKKVQLIIISICSLFSYLFYGSALISENFLSQGMVYIIISIIILSLLSFFLLYAIFDLNSKNYN